MKLTSSIHEKLMAAKVLFAGILSSEEIFKLTRNEMLVRAWKLGGILIELKEEIGHGKWLLWLGGNWPELGERNAQRCMAFFKANEAWKLVKSEEFNGFNIDSIRKFMWGYIPAKEQIWHEGDQKIKPGAHHLTFVNHFSKYDRQLKAGHVNGFALEKFQKELEPMIRRIIEICGWEWISSLRG